MVCIDDEEVIRASPESRGPGYVYKRLVRFGVNRTCPDATFPGLSIVNITMENELRSAGHGVLVWCWLARNTFPCL